MLRGSRPGERRGGRKRDTPNRRTVLTDRILSIGLDHPTASRRAFLVKLIKDRALPADIRMAVAPKCFPAKRAQSLGRAGYERYRASTTIAQQVLASRLCGGLHTPASVPAIQEWNPPALDALFGVIQDAGADPKARRKAALKVAEFLLPKVGKKAKVLPDEYGFWVNPDLASAYRDVQVELRALVNAPTRNIPAIAGQIKKLEARSEAIRRRLQVPCPTKYRNDQAAEDYLKLMQFAQLRDDETALTETQKAEEAHLKVRFDVFAYVRSKSRATGSRRCRTQEQRSQRSRVFGDFLAPSFSRAGPQRV